MLLTECELEFLKRHLLEDDRDHGVILQEESLESSEITNNLVKKKILDIVGPIENLSTKIFQLSPLGCGILMKYLGERLYREYQIVENIGAIHKPTMFSTWRGIIIGKSCDRTPQVTSARADVILPFVRELFFVPKTSVVIKPSPRCINPIRLTLVRN